jgi:hypothetical protein
MKNSTMKKMAEMIEKHDICPLSTPLEYQGKTVTGARRVRVPVVRDRIEAVRYAKDTFGSEVSDAIMAGVASSVLVFGAVVENEQGVHLEGELTLPVDYLINHLEYGEFVNLSILMGKPRPSSESQNSTSNQPSES